MRQLRQVKEAFPHVKVTVGICSDELVMKYKGGPLVMTYDERVASVAECKYVDNIVDHGMFYPTVELLDELEADLIAHDKIPYGCPDGDDCYKPFKDIDRFLTTERTEGISTTDLIQRIVDMNKEFSERNMKRGKSG
ncbi:Choline-phosphate cytidylyltransferase A, variant 2 [Parelaphostrongylus tenuis]|nr:Choline-phosphate cytidylyltransferase A, variant 2 [Parelaphostrongylus tenuis]